MKYFVSTIFTDLVESSCNTNESSPHKKLSILLIFLFFLRNADVRNFFSMREDAR